MNRLRLSQHQSILTLHKAGWSKRAIARELELNRETVSKYLRAEAKPLSEVTAGRLDPYGFLDSGDGGRVGSGILSGYYRQETNRGAVWKVDGFVSRSLFDLYSNFTFFLHSPQGDAIQQHDSRLQQGSNAQYLRPYEIGGLHGLLTAGANFHASQINVGLYPRLGRTPIGVTTRANAEVTNGAGYIQDAMTLWKGKLQLSGATRSRTLK